MSHEETQLQYLRSRICGLDIGKYTDSLRDEIEKSSSANSLIQSLKNYETILDKDVKKNAMILGSLVIPKTIPVYEDGILDLDSGMYLLLGESDLHKIKDYIFNFIECIYPIKSGDGYCYVVPSHLIDVSGSSLQISEKLPAIIFRDEQLEMVSVDESFVMRMIDYDLDQSDLDSIEMYQSYIRKNETIDRIHKLENQLESFEKNNVCLKKNNKDLYDVRVKNISDALELYILFLKSCDVFEDIKSYILFKDEMISEYHDELEASYSMRNKLSEFVAEAEQMIS